MSVDLGTPAIEIAIGLAFVFFLLSLVVSAGTEGLAWVTKQRPRTLEKGIKRLLGDDEVADAVISHPLVQSDVTTPAGKRPPSYVSPNKFALALVQTLRKGHGDAGGPVQQVRAGVDSHPEDSPLGAQLRALLDEADQNLAGFRGAVERWFDDGMDRVSGWYKRWSQTVAIVLAVALAIGLNADTIRITERLASDQGLRQAVVKQAEAKAEKTSGGPEAKTGENVSDAFQEVQDLNLPILWSEANAHVSVTTIVGWLLTAIAMGWMSLVEPGDDWTALLPGLLIAGVGIGLVNPAIASTAVGVVHPRRSGMASGISSTFRQVGIATGIAALGVVFRHQITSGVTERLSGTKLAGDTGRIANLAAEGGHYSSKAS